MHSLMLIKNNKMSIYAIWSCVFVDENIDENIVNLWFENEFSFKYKIKSLQIAMLF